MICEGGGQITILINFLTSNQPRKCPREKYVLAENSLIFVFLTSHHLSRVEPEVCLQRPKHPLSWHSALMQSTE